MIGLPGSGKTTVMRKFMSEYEWKNDKPELCEKQGYFY